MNGFFLIRHHLILIFLYMFCSILCLGVEDAFSGSIKGVVFILDDYWRSLIYMAVSSVFIVFCDIFSGKSDDQKTNKYIVHLPLTALLIFSVVVISNSLYEYFFGKAGGESIYVAAINVFAIIAYLAWSKFEKTNIRKNNTKLYYSVIVGSMVLFICVGGFIANKYLPISLVKTVNQCYEINLSVGTIGWELENKDRVYNDTDDVIENVRLDSRRDLKSGKIKYKKINDKEFSLSWESELGAKEIKKNERLHKVLPFIDNSDFIFTKGTNTKKFKIASADKK